MAELRPNMWKLAEAVESTVPDWVMYECCDGYSNWYSREQETVVIVEMTRFWDVTINVGGDFQMSFRTSLSAYPAHERLQYACEVTKITAKCMSYGPNGYKAYLKSTYEKVRK